jgi:hypothetical protein
MSDKLSDSQIHILIVEAGGGRAAVKVRVFWLGPKVFGGLRDSFQLVKIIQHISN